MRRNKAKIQYADRGIGIATASTAIDPKLLKQGLPRFARWGIPVRVDDDTHSHFRYFAGTDEVRAATFARLVRDPSLGTIWCARGGYGAARILPLLDKFGVDKALRRDPKLLIGYSDVTALHFYFGALGLPSVHAPMPATSSWQKMKPGTDKILRATLAGELATGKKSHTAAWKTKVIHRGAAEGIIRGGNLTLLTSLAGTPYQPDLRGCILFLEDCAELPYRVDRMLTQLHQAGVFRGLRGVLLGDFEADVVYREAREKKYWPEIFAERFAGIPVLGNLPVGHGAQNEPLPLGVKAAISGGKLILLDQPVQPAR